MTTLYLARHGETDYNRDGVVQGRGVDVGLNAAGHLQAERLAERLAPEPLDAIYASALRRARETAAAVARRHPHLAVASVADFDEMAWGVWEGRRHDAASTAAMEAAYARWRAGDFAYAVEGGESALAVRERALRGLGAVLERHAGGAVLVVTHGRLLRVLLATVLPGYRLDQMHEVAHANAGLNRIDHDGEGFRAVFLNDTDHLAGPARLTGS